MTNSTYIIAEAGSNFDGQLSQAKELIDVAVKAKVDAVKFQMFQAKILYPNKDDPVHSRVKDCELPREWIPELYSYATNQNIDFLVSPFDLEAIDILEKVGVVAYKWGSSETTNHQLLIHGAKTKKPIYLSTGMCTMADIAEAIEILDANGCPKITLLHCYSVYPTAFEDANLRAMETLGKAFRKSVGFSDHSLGISLPIAATALGAKVIEKHFTLDRSLIGPDHSYALEPNELVEMVCQIRNVESALGSNIKKMHPDESAWGRREGIYAKNFISKGQIITKNDVFIKRPAISIPARYLSTLIGMVSSSDIDKNSPIMWNHLG